MSNEILISVVISTYNHEKYIKECLDSVLAQNINDMEIIVLDDCSTDNTSTLVQPYLDDERITYIRNKTNLGGRKNNTQALTLGTGKYHVWLHGDDYYLDGHLQSHVDALENHPDCSLAYSPCYWVDEDSNILKLLNHPGHCDSDYYGDRNEVADLLIYDNYITPSSVVFRRDDLNQVGLFHPSIPGADWDLYCRFAIETKGFAFISEASTMYRIHRDQISVKFYASDDPVKAHFHVVTQAFESQKKSALYGFEPQIFDHLETRILNYSKDIQDSYLPQLHDLKERYFPNSINNDFVCKTSAPLVSVIVPTYNRPELLKYALESLIQQEYQNWEAIVINDAGQDVEELLTSFDSMNRIQYISHTNNLGLSAARNTGVKVSSGEIICYLDDDDTFLPEHLSVVVDALFTTKAGFVYTEAIYISETVDNGTRTEIQRSTPYSNIEYSRDRLNVANFIPVNTWAYTRELHKAVGEFDTELKTYEDWEMLLRLSKLVNFLPIAQLTVEVHARINSGSDNMLARENSKLADHCIQLYDRYPAESAEIQHGRIQVLASFGVEYHPPTTYSHSNHSNNKPLSNFEKAVIAAQYTGATLVTVGKAMVENRPEIFENPEIAHKLYIEIANEIDQRSVEWATQNNAQKTNKNNQEAISLMADILDKDSGNQQAIAIRNRLFEKQQTKNHQYWINNHILREIDGQLFAERMIHKWSHHPIFHCILFLLPGEDNLLADTLDSLAGQMYSDWHLTVISDKPAPDTLWQEMQMLHWVQYLDGANPYELLNNLVNNTPGDWISLIEPGMRVAPHSMIQFANYINEKPDWNLIYSDEDILNDENQRKSPKFKPDFNLDMLRSMPYIGNACFIRKSALISIGGYEALPCVENHDIALKIYEHYGENCIGHITDILFHMPEASLRSLDESILLQTTQNHLTRCNIDGHVTHGYLPETVRVNYEHSGTPLVSVIIPNKDKFSYLQDCLSSLTTKTDYPNFEIIIVDNGSTDPDVIALYQSYRDNMHDKFHVIDYPDEFNFSAMCNLAAENSSGDYLLFLNNDTQIIQAQWLDRMVHHIQRPDVGVVGARLIYPETGRIQHAGIVLGLNAVADHPFNGIMSFNEPGYMGRLQIDQNYSAVTGACFLVDRKAFEAVDGMDDEFFKISYNDVDLCLKIRESGLRVVWTPYATVVHYGSISQKSISDNSLLYKNLKCFNRERASMHEKWLHKLAFDSTYNPNLSLQQGDMRTDANIPINWDVNFHDRPRILSFPLISGSGEYRVIHPFNALSNAALLQCEHYRLDSNFAPSITQVARMQPDTILLQDAFEDKQTALIQDVKKYMPYVYRVFSIDDLLTNIPEDNTSYKHTKRFFREIKSRLRELLSCYDRLIVSTQPLADEFKDLISDIKVIPNRLAKDKWLHLNSERNISNKLRVGWVGAQQHFGDLKIIFDVVKQTASEVDWVFMGMCPEEIKPYISEYHEFVSISQYPEKMASLNLDLAIAPLEINAFNEAKSNLRLLEYGVLGWPVICTDIYPYKTNNAPVSLVENNTESWIAAIREFVRQPEMAHQSGDKLRQWVKKNYLLEDHLTDWMNALSPRKLDIHTNINDPVILTQAEIPERHRKTHEERNSA